MGRVRAAAASVRFKQSPGLLGEHPADFAAFSFDAGNLQVIIGGRLMPHPRDHSRFGSTLNRDSLRSGHGSAADGSRMNGDGARESDRKRIMALREVQKLNNGCMKVLDVS